LRRRWGYDVAADSRSIADLVVAIDGDVRLRIGPPPPTADQIATSRALINQPRAILSA
jgi:hypothetical protein